jgi:hypothetical protein
MGKRSNFERIERDYYKTTDLNAVRPLIDHLNFGNCETRYVEPCAGDGSLVHCLGGLCSDLKCVVAADIEPQAPSIMQMNALHWTKEELANYELPFQHIQYFITNPPWTRNLLHPIIDRLSSVLPTWLLLDADWMHTKQAVPYLNYCERIVSIGRVKWMQGTKMTGKDNCCWYLFSKARQSSDFSSAFYGRKIT